MESLTSGYNECENACFNTTGEMEGSIIEFQSSIQNTGTGWPILKDTILVVEIYMCFVRQMSYRDESEIHKYLSHKKMSYKMNHPIYLTDS